CVDAFRQYNSNSGASVSEVTVLCRDEDVHEKATSDQTVSDAFLGKLDYGGMTFYFVNIFDWIIFQLVRMSAAARLSFFEDLEVYVRNPNTAAKVKQFWKDYHEEKLAEA